jgi:hypothetical protein
VTANTRCQPHDRLFRHRLAFDRACNRALADHQHPVAETQKLRQFRRDDDDADAGAREIAQQPVDFRFGANIDAARRLVHQDDLGIDRQLLGNRHLLLVAARERRDRHVDAAHPHAKPLGQIPRAVRFGLRIQQAERPGQRFQVENGNVLGDGQLQEHARTLAVLRKIDNTCLHGLRIGLRPQPLSMQLHLAFPHRTQSANALGNLGAARADQSANAENFALAQFEADIVEAIAVAKIADAQNGLARLLRQRLLFRIELGDLAADHAAYDIIRCQVRDILR